LSARATGSGRPVAHHSAYVDERVTLVLGTRVWHLAQIREQAQLGSECIVGRDAYVDQHQGLKALWPVTCEFRGSGGVLGPDLIMKKAPGRGMGLESLP
jgi:hypothetical protein